MTGRARCKLTPICLLVLWMGLTIALPCRAAAGTRVQSLCPLRLLGWVAGSLQLRTSFLPPVEHFHHAPDEPHLGLVRAVGPTTVLGVHDDYVDPEYDLRLRPEGVLELFGMESDGTARNVFRLFTRGSSVSESTRIRCRPNWNGVSLTAIADF
ncbi:MAG: hypothetical protein ACQEXJ_22125 [Myxococcota bacterium]